MLFYLGLVLILSVWVSVQADLKPYDKTASSMFFVSDSNKDRIITLAEIESSFKISDRDSDGKVSRYEYTYYLDQHLPVLHAFSHSLYDIYDVNNDGVLEIRDYQNLFKLMDSDGNGVIVEPEYVRFWAILLETLEQKYVNTK